MSISIQKYRELVFQFLYSRAFGEGDFEMLIHLMMRQRAISRKSASEIAAEAGRIWIKAAEFDQRIEKHALDFSLEKIGRLISQGWNFKKGLSKLITNQKLDNVFGEVISMGAYGGKLLGAGGGGFLMFIAEPSKKTAIINKVESMGFKYYNFDFDSKGSNVREVY